MGRHLQPVRHQRLITNPLIKIRFQETASRLSLFVTPLIITRIHPVFPATHSPKHSKVAATPLSDPKPRIRASLSSPKHPQDVRSRLYCEALIRYINPAGLQLRAKTRTDPKFFIPNTSDSHSRDRIQQLSLFLSLRVPQRQNRRQKSFFVSGSVFVITSQEIVDTQTS